MAPDSMKSLVQDIVALLAITNPLGAIPAFLAITERMEPKERWRAGVRASLAVATILATAALAGRPILKGFGISMPAFQVAGGLVILLMGLEMLRGVPTKVQHDEEPKESAEDRVLVPLAMPLIAGPGAITTVITLSARAANWQETTMLLTAVVVIGGSTLLTLSSAAWLGRKIGGRGQRILLRFMGLVLAAVGAQVLLSGLHTFTPGP
jgi:multiple antibiotic resistance protein